MTASYSLRATVTHGDVDGNELMLLARIFKLLQEAAICHANEFGTGTNAVAERAESWVLNRIAAAILRYPAAGEPLRVVTWSTGIRGFKGYRDFRVYDGSDALVITASSLWLYVSLRTKSIVRVPRDVSDRFPVGREGAWCAELDHLDFAEVATASAPAHRVSLRYSDFDVNAHVNNAAYFDFVQSALAAAAMPPRPGRVSMKFAREIPAGATDVDVRLDTLPAGGAAFEVRCGAALCALGTVGANAVAAPPDAPRN